MLSSQFRQVLLQLIKDNAKSITQRPLKPYEINHFFNLKEDKLNIIIQKAKHDLERIVNEYLEDIK